MHFRFTTAVDAVSTKFRIKAGIAFQIQQHLLIEIAPRHPSGDSPDCDLRRHAAMEVSPQLRGSLKRLEE